MVEERFCLILSALVGMGMTAGVMPLLLKFCRMRGYYDLPNGRKVHRCAVPRLGGLLFMPSMLVSLVAVLFLYADEGVLVLRVPSVAVAVGAFLLYIIGAVDDLVGMKANQKFAVQTVAALLMPFCGLLVNNFYGLFGLYELPVWFSYPFTVFIILLVVNAINLIDGIDGLASGLCICILVAYILLYLRMERTFGYALVASGLSGSLMAFFCFNMFGKEEKGTKTFMGDSGSLFLGYAVAYMSVKYAMNTPPVLPYRGDALLVSYTLLIVPTFDVVRVALSRLYRGKSIFEADKTHIHHLVMAAGFSMHQTWAIIIGLFFFFCGLNTALGGWDVSDTWVVAADVLAFCLFHAGMRLRARRREMRFE